MNCRRIGIVAVAILIATPAWAFDFPAKTRPTAYGWGGCYVGGNIANAWSQFSITDPAGVVVAPPPFSFGTAPTSGIAGGGQVGCDKEIGPWLIGIRGMFDAASIQGSSMNPAPGAVGAVPSGSIQTTDKANWIADVTARFGYTILPDILLYGQGGAAWRHDNFNSTTLVPILALPAGTTVFTGPVTSIGWTVGAGAEWMLLPDLSVFVEYDFFGFGAGTDTFRNNVTPSFTLSAANENINLVMLGLNYRFHLSGFNRN